MVCEELPSGFLERGQIGVIGGHDIGVFLDGEVEERAIFLMTQLGGVEALVLDQKQAEPLVRASCEVLAWRDSQTSDV